MDGWMDKVKSRKCKLHSDTCIVVYGTCHQSAVVGQRTPAQSTQSMSLLFLSSDLHHGTTDLQRMLASFEIEKSLRPNTTCK